MGKYNVVVTQDYSLPVETVFARLSDHNRLSTVLGIPVRRVVDGRTDINGEGSVRRLGFWPVAIEETVTAVEPNQSIAYRITKGGAPLTNHSGVVTFTKVGNGVRVQWHISFDAMVPLAGPIVREVLTQGIRLGLRRIK